MRSLFIHTDSNGNIPLWEAMLAQNDSLIKLLKDHGANLSHANVPQFAAFAIEQGNFQLLKDIILHGGDVTLAGKDGSTPLHAAVTSGNMKIIEFLLDQGADIDKYDDDGWTPRSLADFQGKEDIKALFESRKKDSSEPVIRFPEKRSGPPAQIMKYPSTGTILVPPNTVQMTRVEKNPRRQVNTFQNSLFGFVSAATRGEHNYTLVIRVSFH